MMMNKNEVRQNANKNVHKKISLRITPTICPLSFAQKFDLLSYISD
jgi:hypothetical protein